MRGLFLVTNKETGKMEYLNPDHIRSVREASNGTEITFSDGTKLVVEEKVKDVIDKVQSQSL